jgi:glycerate 2-kinase
MKIVIAPDSFKDSLSALEVGKSIREGIQKVDASIETVLIPMADGGEGTVQSLIDATGGMIVHSKVHDPLFRIINSFYGIMGDGKTAVIEMAAASGLPLLKQDERNPLKATTFGTGELIINALDKGCTKIILGLGGSATNDGGAGMAQALGVRFFDDKGNDIGHGGEELIRIEKVDLSGVDPRIKTVEFIAACDVENPLCGESGASNTFGRQKGANDTDVITLDKGLAHVAQVIREEYGKDFKDFPGAGAAGGLGFGVMTFLNGKIEKGIDIVANATNLEEKMKGASLVITGEGKIDFQTAFGKTPLGVAQVAKKLNIPVIAIAGSLGKDYNKLYKAGFNGMFSIIDKPMSLTKAIVGAKQLIENTTEAIIRFWISKK